MLIRTLLINNSDIVLLDFLFACYKLVNALYSEGDVKEPNN